MAELLQTFVLPSGNIPLSGLSQWLSLHPRITIRSVAAKSVGNDIAVAISYSDTEGVEYKAAVFSGANMGFDIQALLAANSALRVAHVSLVSAVRSGIITPRSVLFYVDISRQHQLAQFDHLSGIAQEAIAAGTDGQFLRYARFDATNIGDTAATAGSWASLLNDGSGAQGFFSDGGAGGEDASVESTTTTPAPLPCEDCQEFSTTGTQTPPPFDPPPDFSCCLRYDYECICPDGTTPQWSLTNVECVNNALCVPFEETCDDTNYHFEAQNACRCGQAPVFVDPPPEPPCVPFCCPGQTTTTPADEDCCLEAQWDCVCSENEEGALEERWELTSIDCVANGSCSDGVVYEESDQDNDGRIDRVVFSETNACDCGTTDEAVLKALLPADKFENGEPKTDPECCESCCLKARWFCENINGVSTWQFLDATCIDNADCSAGTVRTCTDTLFTVTKEDGCTCGDSPSEDDVDAELPGEPQDCTPSCATNCCLSVTWDCTYTKFGSEWSLTSVECIDNNLCSDQLQTSCSDEQYVLTVPNSCVCESSVDASDIPAGYPQNCDPSCEPAFPEMNWYIGGMLGWGWWNTGTGAVYATMHGIGSITVPPSAIGTTLQFKLASGSTASPRVALLLQAPDGTIYSTGSTDVSSHDRVAGTTGISDSAWTSFSIGAGQSGVWQVYGGRIGLSPQIYSRSDGSYAQYNGSASTDEVYADLAALNAAMRGITVQFRASAALVDSFTEESFDVVHYILEQTNFNFPPTIKELSLGYTCTDGDWRSYNYSSSYDFSELTAGLRLTTADGPEEHNDFDLVRSCNFGTDFTQTRNESQTWADTADEASPSLSLSVIGEYRQGARANINGTCFGPTCTVNAGEVLLSDVLSHEYDFLWETTDASGASDIFGSRTQGTARTFTTVDIYDNVP
jgi:hypothetical protein